MYEEFPLPYLFRVLSFIYHVHFCLWYKEKKDPYFLNPIFYSVVKFVIDELEKIF